MYRAILIKSNDIDQLYSSSGDFLSMSQNIHLKWDCLLFATAGLALINIASRQKIITSWDHTIQAVALGMGFGSLGLAVIIFTRIE